MIRPFQSDIAAWVTARIHEKIAERREHLDRPRIQERTRIRLEQEIAGLEAELTAVVGVDKFTYGTGSSYAEGILGHDDILKLTPACVAARPLLREIVAKRFPFVFVDESQDTDPEVVEALRHVAGDHPGICVGFFGDPMQKIYMSGAGAIPLNVGWSEITKAENFRCPTSVLGVINAIRADGDGLRQIRGRTEIIDGIETSVTGTSSLFILPADADRSACLAAIRRWLAAETADDLWLSDLREGDVRMLVLVHRMAASRLGFPTLYSSLNDKAPMSLSEGLSDGTAWPLRPFVQSLLPLVSAARVGNRFEVMSALRIESPRLEPARLRGQEVAPVLLELQQAVDRLLTLMEASSPATIREVLIHARDSELLRLDDRFVVHLEAEPVDDGSGGFGNIQAFLACGVAELWAYRRYLAEESPFATHHGVKGAQFERVLVVVDDEEASFKLYSYGKYFGYEALSDNDLARIAAGEDSVLDRTRRLFYVCCSRATKDLAVVIFVPEVASARAAIVERNLFPEVAIRGIEHLA